MKVILVREFGGPGVVELEEVPAPLPAAGLVLLRSHTIRANPYDTYMRSGVYAISRPAIDTRLWAFESGKMFPESPRAHRQRFSNQKLKGLQMKKNGLTALITGGRSGIGPSGS